MRGNKNFIVLKVFFYKNCGSALLISAKFSITNNENYLNTLLKSVSKSLLSPIKIWTSAWKRMESARNVSFRQFGLISTWESKLPSPSLPLLLSHYGPSVKNENEELQKRAFKMNWPIVLPKSEPQVVHEKFHFQEGTSRPSEKGLVWFNSRYWLRCQWLLEFKGFWDKIENLKWQITRDKG